MSINILKKAVLIMVVHYVFCEFESDSLNAVWRKLISSKF